MRYLDVILYSIPCFILIALVGMGSGAVSATLPVSIIAGLLGLALGSYMVSLIRANLLRDASLWVMRPVSGGIWFFLGLGILGGIVCETILSYSPPLFFSLLVFSGVFASVTWSVVALSVFQLERRHKKQFLMGPQGFYFDDKS